MAGSAGYLLMRREKMACKLRLHHMAALPAELVGFHVLHCAIRELAPDNHVRHGHDREKLACALPGCFVIERLAQHRRSPASPERDADRNQAESSKTQNRDGDERQQSDVRVADMPA